MQFKKIAPNWRTVLSALLLVPSFAPWNCYGLIWISLVPWFWALKLAESPRAALREGLWLSFFMTLGGFYWIAHVLQEFGNLPRSVSILGLLLIALVNQPQFLIFAPIWRWVRGRAGESDRLLWSMALSLTLALAYTGLDWILPKLFVDTLGHSLYVARTMRQAADLGGATLLTFLIFLFNETLFQALWSGFLKPGATQKNAFLVRAKTALPSLLAAIVLCTACFAYGHFRFEQIEALESKPQSRLQAAVIQANIGDFDKIAAERGISGAAEKVLETFFTLSDRALAMKPRPQVVIWPETSYPSTFRTPQTSEEAARDHKVEEYVKSRKVTLLFGGYDHLDGKDFNAFFFLAPDAAGSGVEAGHDLQIYRKNMLLLFGEYIPGAEQFQFIKNSFPQVGNFGRGAGPSVMKVAGARINPIICYEALFPNYVIAGARQASQMILNITNDSWFGSSGEPQLHLSLTTFRSIETRLPQLRATNTGISTLILPDGEITQATPMDQAVILNASVPLIEPVWTLMQAWGDWFGPTALLMGWLGLFALLYFERKSGLALSAGQA